MTPAAFVDGLKQVTLRNVFNPYQDICALHDHPDSPSVRADNLRRYLATVSAAGVHSLWLGRDCGYRGARRTGIALTDERHLNVLSGQLTIAGGLTKATFTPEVSERTATEVWKAIAGITAPLFLWNAFPFHPFSPHDQLSNRQHTSAEAKQTSSVLDCLVEWLQPTLIVALGADAEKAAGRFGRTVVRVRHPSYGGHLEFSRNIRAIYGTLSLQQGRTLS